MSDEQRVTKSGGGFSINLSGVVALSIVITVELIILHIFGVI